MSLILTAVLLFGVPAAFAVRTNQTITVASGTPARLSSTHLYVREVFIQMAIGGTSAGYVMIVSGHTPSKTAAGDVTAQLAPATSTAPGGAYSDSSPQADIDLYNIWVDGDHTGDNIIISYDTRSF
jgi:hypothetical protein